MEQLPALVVLLGLSIFMFLVTVSIVCWPLAGCEIQKTLDFKLACARTLSSPKIETFAGSNGRCSHRCEQFTATLGRPCVSASNGVGIGLGISLEFLLDLWRPVWHPGDVVYVPLEYGQYPYSRAEMQALATLRRLYESDGQQSLARIKLSCHPINSLFDALSCFHELSRIQLRRVVAATLAPILLHHAPAP